MMKKLIILIIIALNCNISFAQQTPTDAIKQTINNMFTAMRTSDSTLLRSTFANGMIFQVINTQADGSSKLAMQNPDAFIKTMGTPHKGVYDERITFGNINIDGDLASVWAPYQFYIDDKFSHCGVDVFQLMKTKDSWKIIYLVYNRRKDNCVE
jgi:hypothetical protein